MAAPSRPNTPIQRQGCLATQADPRDDPPGPGGGVEPEAHPLSRCGYQPGCRLGNSPSFLSFRQAHWPARTMEKLAHTLRSSCLSPNPWDTRRGPRGSFPSFTHSTRRAPLSEKPPRLCLFLKLASLPGRWSRGERHGLMRIRSARPQEAEGPPGVLVFHSCSVPEPDRAPA
jgi:hypothetical protein